MPVYAVVVAVTVTVIGAAITVTGGAVTVTVIGAAVTVTGGAVTVTVTATQLNMDLLMPALVSLLATGKTSIPPGLEE